MGADGALFRGKFHKPPVVRRELTQARLKEVLFYEPSTGLFTWVKARGPRANIGDPAGCPDKDGYVRIRVDYAMYRAHRLAWLYMTGRWPQGEIDHANGIPNDNSFQNLREATTAENQQNRKLYATNSSGLTGAVWHKHHKKWMAKINAKHLGYFETAEQAHEAYCAAKAVLHTFQPTLRSK